MIRTELSGLFSVADNLTTALLMCAVVIVIGKEDKKFLGLACLNIVVAANVGGAFSPFGDIATLMVWQKGLVQFQDFLVLIVPSVVTCLVPAVIMSFAIADKQLGYAASICTHSLINSSLM